MGKHVPQIMVHRIKVCGEELGIEVVTIILPQKLLEPFPALGPVDGIAHASWQKLHRVIPQLCDLMGTVIQINGIAHMIEGDVRIVGNVDFVGRLTVANGDGVTHTGDRDT